MESKSTGSDVVSKNTTSYYDLSPRAVFATMAGAMLAMFMASLDQTIVGTAMPRIVSELHGFEHYSGVFTSYLIASTVVLPIAGKLSDIYGRKFFLLLGIIWFVIASVLCGASQSIIQLIAFRGLQGMGAGIMQVMVWSVIADLYPPAKRGRVMGLIGSVFGLSSVIGPLIGGYLTDGPGWRYAFYVNVPVGALATFIMVLFFPHIRPKKEEGFKIDYAGSLALVTTLVPFLLGLSMEGPAYPWTSPTILSLMAISLVSGFIFFRIESTASHPILPLQLFCNSVFSVSVVAAALSAVAMFGATLFIPLFVQSVLGSTATESGKILMPLTISLVITATISGHAISKFGKYKPFAVLGMVITTIGLYLVSMMSVTTTYETVITNAVILGIGLGAAMPVFSVSVQNAVKHQLVGTATSTLQLMRTVGDSLGVALFGSILANQFGPSFRQVISPEVFSKIPQTMLSRLNNPQTFLGAESFDQLESLFSHENIVNKMEFLGSVQQAAKIALSNSLHQVFIVATGIIFLATMLTLFLREIPLRETNHPEEVMKEIL